jgi:hypothetical protein
MRFGEDYSRLGYESALFSHGHSWIDQTFNHDELPIKDISFALFLNPYSDGTIFHYKYTGSNSFTSGIMEIQMRLDGGNLSVSYTGDVENGTVHIDDFLGFNEWSWLAFEDDWSQGKYKLHISREDDTKSVIELVGSIKELDILTPGLLRIGGSQDPENPPISGLMSCVQIFDKRIVDKKEDAISECQQENWDTSRGKDANC